LEDGFVLHHDNAPCHTSLVIRQFLGDKQITCPHPPYSPDLAPFDFWLFPKIELTVKGNRFDTIPEIEAATEERLRALTRDDFPSYFSSWQDRWNKCIDCKEDYFEGDCTFKLM
jgi:hypothetical protein